MILTKQGFNFSVSKLSCDDSEKEKSVYYK